MLNRREDGAFGPFYLSNHLMQLVYVDLPKDIDLALDWPFVETNQMLAAQTYCLVRSSMTSELTFNMPNMFLYRFLVPGPLGIILVSEINHVILVGFS